MKSRILTMDMISQYQAYLFHEERSKATIEKYTRDIKKFFTYLKDEKKITKENIISYKQEIIKNYKPASVNSMLIAINGLLNFLGLGDCKVKLLKMQKKSFMDEAHQLTKEEYARLLETADRLGNEKLKLIMETICSTGIRVSELQFITVQALKKQKTLIMNKGKVREILIPKMLKEVLTNYCKEQKIEQGPVFITRNGNHLNRSNIWTMMKQLCEKANVKKEKVFPHNLRHLFALLFYNVEKNLVHLADVLGHSSIETTRIYTKSSIKDCQITLEKLQLIALNKYPYNQVTT